MKRRSVLRTLAALPAAALPSARVLKAQQVIPPKPTPAAIEQIPVIESTVPDLTSTPIPHFFTQDQFAALRRLADIIAPAADDVPGALRAGAVEFLDFLIGESPEERQKFYREGLDELNRRSEEKFQRLFAHLDSSQADGVLALLCSEWAYKPEDRLAVFLGSAKDDILAATENSHAWVRVMSKRVRSAGGVGMYWFPIE